MPSSPIFTSTRPPRRTGAGFDGRRDDNRRARLVYAGVALAAIAFAFYGSLIPFDLHRIPLGAAWTRFRAELLVLPEHISRTDFLANILLFVPVGFALAGTLLLGHRGAARAIGATVLILPASGAVSLAAEFLQVFAMERVPSNTDVAAQTIGAILGIAAWLVAGPALTAWIRESARARSGDRLQRVLLAYAAGWILVSLAPFDITLDLGELAGRLRSGAVGLAPPAGVDVPVAYRLWDALAELLSATPLGVLGLYGVQGRPSYGRAAAFGFGAALVILVEAAQIFILSHAALVTDVLASWMGVALGVWAGRRYVRQTILPPRDSARRAVVSWRAVGLLFAWCAVLAVYHWMPYDFTPDKELIRSKLAALSLVPFAAYRRGTELNALSDLLRKLALALPLGVLASYVTPGRRLGRLPVVAWLLFSAGVFGAIEAGQLLLPSRYADVTDVLVGIGGTAGGLVIGRWVQR